MSMLFSQISKLSARKENIARLFSTLPQSPYLLLGSRFLRESQEGRVGQCKFFDPTNEKQFYTMEKTLPKKLTNKPPLGASQGWVACIDYKDNNTLQLTDFFKPWLSSIASPSIISLPSIGFEPSTYATEVSLSSHDPLQDQDKGDFYVAAKFDEYHVSVCRPSFDSKWTHIKTPYNLLPASGLVYSKRDKAFCFTSFKGLFKATLDLTNNDIDFHELRLLDMPRLPDACWEMLDKCFMSKHLVESNSGDERFFIKWYRMCISEKTEEGTLIHSVIKRIMVFREDEKSKNFYYTQDIGDLCIFLGSGEAFCVSTSKYPGLKPNSIYYTGSGLGCYDLASGRYRSFDPPNGTPLVVPFPFWFNPR